MLDDNDEIVLLSGSALLAYLPEATGTARIRRPGTGSVSDTIGRRTAGDLVRREIGYDGDLTEIQLRLLAPMLRDLDDLRITSLNRHNVEFELRVSSLEFHSIELGQFNLIIRKSKLLALLVAINLTLDAVPKVDAAVQAIPHIIETIPDAVDAIIKAQELGKKLLDDTIFKENRRHQVPRKTYQDRDAWEINEELRNGRELQATLMTNI